MPDVTLTSATMTILLGLLGLLLAILMHKVMSDSSNNLDWWQFIASTGADGKQYADIDKLGKVAGIFIGSWVIVKTAYDMKLDALILSAYFAYVGGVAGYSAYLRSKRDTT